MARTVVHGVTLGSLAMLFAAQPRLVERRLADHATIQVPSAVSIDNPIGYQDEPAGRITYTFSSTYLWASFMSASTYRQLLVVSIMAPDATEAEYAAWPRRFTVSYEQRKPLRTSTIGTGTLTVFEGIYSRGNLTEPSYEYRFSDRAKRLQLTWHATRKEVGLEAGIAAVTRMASSFRLLRDPVDLFAAMRAAPQVEADARASRVASARAMLQREGFGTPVPGTPVLRAGVHLEWMDDPEVRYQLLVPLGRVRVAANASPAARPRPVWRRQGDPVDAAMAGTIGWYEFVDGEWHFSNQDNDYLPFTGVASLLASQARDPAYVYFHYVGTVRVEEEAADGRLTSLRWFLDGLPDLMRRWRAGSLVRNGVPEPSPPEAGRP